MVVERLSTTPKPITHLYPSTELVTSHKNNLEIFIRWNFFKPVSVSISFIHLFYCLLIPPKTAQYPIQILLFPAFLSSPPITISLEEEKCGIQGSTQCLRSEILVPTTAWCRRSGLKLPKMRPRDHSKASLPATFNLLLPSQAAARALWLFRADSTAHSHICTCSCLANLPSPAVHNKTQIQPISPL